MVNAARPPCCATNLSLPRPTGCGSATLLSAPGQRQLGLLLRLSERVHQAGRGLAGAGRYAGGLGYQGLAAGAAGPTTRPGLVVRSGRDGQYVGNVYKALLRDAQAQLSHSRRGECYDNALPGTTQAESLWSRLKAELLELRDWPFFADLADAQASVADYFDYCNHKRRHSSIGYLKPYLLHQQ